jgi:hypothetical protein
MPEHLHPYLEVVKGTVTGTKPSFPEHPTLSQSYFGAKDIFLNSFQTRMKMLGHDIFAKYAGSGIDSLYICVKYEEPFMNLHCRKLLSASQNWCHRE